MIKIFVVDHSKVNVTTKKMIIKLITEKNPMVTKLITEPNLMVTELITEPNPMVTELITELIIELIT